MRRAGNESEPKFPTQVVSLISDSPSPPIIETFGRSSARTQLFSVPPWAVSFAFAILTATFSDLAKHRFLFVIFPLLVTLTGFPTPPGTKNDHPTQYGVLFLAVSGVCSAILLQSSSFTTGYPVYAGFICRSFLANLIYFSLVLENRRDNSNKSATIPESEKQRMGNLNPNYHYVL